MNSERLIHSFKTVIAVILGFLAMRITNSPHAQWIIITVLVVMCAQIYVGSVLQKSYLRFLGTLCGCILGVIVIECFQSSWWSVLLVLMVASFIFSYIATSGKDTLSYFSTMGSVTLALILLGQPDPSLDYAASRFFEITVGIFIATVVSQFVFPIHAKKHLHKTQVQTLKQLKDFYDAALVSKNIAQIQTAESHDLDETIVKSLLKQRQLAKESQREHLGETFNANRFDQYLFCERQILRAIHFMHIAQVKLQDAMLPEVIALMLQSFHEETLRALDTLATNLAEKKQQSLTLPSLTALQNLQMTDKASLLPRHGLYLDALIFNAEIVVDSIGLLGGLYGKDEL